MLKNNNYYINAHTHTHVYICVYSMQLGYLGKQWNIRRFLNQHFLSSVKGLPPLQLRYGLWSVMDKCSSPSAIACYGYDLKKIALRNVTRVSTLKKQVLNNTFFKSIGRKAVMS